MCGGVPFAEDAEDPYEIYESIIKTVNIKIKKKLKIKFKSIKIKFVFI
jgi:hypothetical protein